MSRSRATTSTIGIAVLVAALTACLPAAFAHVPAFGPSGGAQAVQTPGPEVSRALYGYLAPGQARETYTFTVESTVTRSVNVIVPAFAEHRDFRPEFEISENGRIVSKVLDRGPDDREKEWEPFSLMSFWHGPDETFEFEPGVRYEVSVLPGEGPEASGRYVLVFGGPEQFTAEEAVSTISYLPRIWFGAYGGAPPRWNPWGLIPLVALGVLALLAALGARNLLRRSLST